MIVSIIMGESIGIISAVFQNTWIDHLSMTFALIFISTPVFWFGMVLIYLFSMTLGWLPVSGMGEGVFNIRHLILPAITLGSRFAICCFFGPLYQISDAGSDSRGLYTDCPGKGYKREGSYTKTCSKECINSSCYGYWYEFCFTIKWVCSD